MTCQDNSPASVWGFHVHMEIPNPEFQKSLLVQDACREYLEARDVNIDAMDVMKKGYGPHLEEMWELRVETQKDDVLGHLGHIIAFMAVNRGNLPAYIHPVMHDVTLPGIQQLKHEGETNQQQSLWFGERVDQLQDFFFNPPLTEDGDIVDTRTSRIYTQDEIQQSKQEGLSTLQAERSSLLSGEKWTTIDPVKVVNGFHFHAEFKPETEQAALLLHARFMGFLKSRGVVPDSDIHQAGEYVPFKNSCWVVKVEHEGCFSIFGEAVAWCMANRGDVPVYFLCKTWEGHEADLATLQDAHQNNSFFLDRSPEFSDGEHASSAERP